LTRWVCECNRDLLDKGNLDPQVKTLNLDLGVYDCNIDQLGIRVQYLSVGYGNEILMGGGGSNYDQLPSNLDPRYKRVVNMSY
jgi:hypothetical protein